ncbi:(2Fe-2S) ferredoxin domain-containing protein [Gloeothece verrucosa]|uniref:2Fe-2S ferredoxin n=1 Tax=Gloeothece verrucosa (strain PCC 7822) TaxID=497965 RepID=E0U5Z1_GLOV7|nr:(2Fe-2S) ferredoxin domain-containing protein [Gloeothece verrucosa]ADN17100.1 conserved hypothetical protein [Gloeothece verrucosa PCC 7822]
MQSNSGIKVLICCNRTCRKSGSSRIFEIFKTNPIPEVEVIKVGCLGECGNGPMVLILPEEIWYWQVQPDEVSMIIQKHLRGHSPIKTMLYPKFHHN